ncbi:hypothetical protein [Methanolobus vulcani]|jgi:hypothetical protein|uniref:Uncharacterized protein n=1 Tax=Methanolobus vulcani TaxID=38026 RepID=A0A7Z8KPP3_9EURY|nr:hypothetical protein [Methanolobus vulcani]TQD23924.1 hypothetical protein FKV42_12020 [Methanolobus vulcani]
MAQSTHGTMGSYAHLMQSLPDYSELIIALLIIVLLLISLDEIMDFIYMVRELFTYKSMPFS